MFKISDSFIKIFLGFCLVLELNIAVIFIAISIGSIARDIDSILQVLFFVVLRIDRVQLVYIIPLSVWLTRKREWGFITGMIISAVITPLLIYSFLEGIH